ncbi:magnesium/cobalt transporter CorA [Odoribacter sp. OttesenSCG-928-J03]|nr:magnesium/cobalt transporter CorA [Odoribacter sp. OttesenSCG-928-J03]MDL2283389.1 magnesium/cobalt transporter CorA [Odoribacter sp. OttesenSCG-928-G04]
MARFLKDKKKSKGAAPGSLIFIGQQRMKEPLINVTQYNSEYIKEGKLKSIDKVNEFLSDEHITWISISGLHNTDLFKCLGEQFNIHPLILEDILNTDERPKLTEDKNHLYFILKSIWFEKESGKIHIEQVSMILGNNYLITIQESDYPFFEDNIKRLYSGLSKIRTYPADYLCYTMIDTLVDSYILNIEALGNAIEAQEKNLLTSDRKIIEDIYHYKTELSYVRKNIRPIKEVITRFMTSDSDLIHQRTYNYIKDLESLITQALESIEIYYTISSEQQNTYSSNISNNTNDVMKVLTIFSAIFIPLTFIAGVYGMNFSHMPELEHPYAYFILWGVMSVIALIMLLYFKRKKWL